MSACFRLFRAECWAEAIHIPKRHRIRFVIKLSRLREINFFIFEVIHFEQRAGAFAGGRREDGRIHQCEAMRIKVIANPFHHFMTHANGGMLAAAAEPQMAMIHQKIDAVVFRRDRVRMFFGNALNDVRIFHIEFKPAMRTGFCTYCARNRQRTFLREPL